MLLNKAADVIHIEDRNREDLLGIGGHLGVVDHLPSDCQIAKDVLVLSNVVQALQNQGSKLRLGEEVPHEGFQVTLTHLLKEFNGRGFIQQFQNSQHFEFIFKVERVQIKTVNSCFWGGHCPTVTWHNNKLGKDKTSRIYILKKFRT